MNTTPIVMTVIVNDSKNFSLYSLYHALGQGFLEFYPILSSSILHSEWENTDYRKIVKRAKPELFKKIVATTEGNYFKKGNVEFLFLPLSYQGQDPTSIKRAQLAHFNGVFIQEDYSESFFKVTLNSLVDMSSGKQAAAVMHSVHRAFCESSIKVRDEWESRGFDFVIENSVITIDKDYDVIIHDLGYTEVPTGTITVAGEWLHPQD